ncbi:MAG: DUF1934 domain-containing protein [Clostridia bacterium]|nr:DUF1934 domain-containing protein [Clostridia bacterium]
MNKKDYVITIKGIQTYDSDDDNIDIEMMAEGDFTFEDGKYFIDYDETEATGMEGTSTTIETDGDYVALTRTGAVDTTLLFIKDRLTTSYYETPYGTMMMGITTEDVKTNLDSDGGKISVKYSISMNNLFSGTNTFEIQVRKI